MAWHRLSWIRAGLALLMGVAGFSLGMALHIVLIPQSVTGHVTQNFVPMIVQNIVSYVPVLAVGLGVTMFAWSNRGNPFYPAWVLPVTVGAVCAVLFLVIILARPNSPTFGRELAWLPYQLIRPVFASLLGGAAMQTVNWRPGT